MLSRTSCVNASSYPFQGGSLSFPLPPAHTLHRTSSRSHKHHVPYPRPLCRCPLCLNVLSSPLPHTIRWVQDYSLFKTQLKCLFLCETPLPQQG